MEHHFNVEIATEYGVSEAIFLSHLWFWVKKNEANGNNFFDGSFWTYNSIKAFEKLFPYLTNKQIRNTLKHLAENGLIQTGKYNASEYNHTTWYSFTKKGIALMESSNCPVGQIEFPSEANRVAPEGKSITDRKPDIKPNSKNNNTFKSEFDELWKLYPRKQGKDGAMKSYVKARKDGASFEDVRKGLEAYREFVKDTDPQYICMGSTWFNQHRWEDDYDIGRGNKERGGVSSAVGGSRGNSEDYSKIVIPMAEDFFSKK